MASREGGIGFILGSVAGVGAAVVWTSRSPAWKTLLERVRTTTDSVDRRIREVDQFVGEITGMAREQASAFKDVAEKTTRRYDEVTEVVQKNLVQSKSGNWTASLRTSSMRWIALSPRRAA